MKANPGGTVTGDAIIGREIEIADLWHKLQTRSVVLSAERRVGKTSILRKMSEHPLDPKSGNSATDDSVFAFAVNNFQLLRSSPSR